MDLLDEGTHCGSKTTVLPEDGNWQIVSQIIPDRIALGMMARHAV
jgi:hypothetical protein